MKRVKPTMQHLSQKHVYADYADADKLMRYAFDSNIKASRFGRLLETMRKRDSFEQPNYPLLIGALTAMGDTEKLRVLMDNYNYSGIHPYYSFVGLRDIIREALVISMILGKTAACGQLLSEYLNDGFPIAPVHMGGDRCSLEFRPLYYTMLTKQYDLVDVYMDLLRKKLSNCWCEEAAEEDMHADVDLTFISALLYDEREFVKVMLDGGYRPGSYVFAELAAYPEAFDGYRKKYFSYYFPERKRPPKQQEFLSRLLTGNERYRFAYLVYDKFGTENADRFFESIDFPKITAVSSSMLLINRMRGFNLSGEQPLDEKCLMKLMDDRLYIIGDMTNVVEMTEENACVFEGKEIIYDIRGHEDQLGLGFPSNITNKMLKQFLKQKLLFDTDDKCSSFLQSVLERNDSTLTVLAVKQGLITRENFSDVIEFLSENRLLIALNEIHKSDI